ncbi:restriction endonuclease [Natronorubrum sp. JWXQ-INN-674]|uniref:Restriction endonuclease n=1 Tax=Natronorubrum halalkaliphilum TaxID=2691917 RepID=A0A6B0VT17_9EURY|nr:restriction endonuclease [Natronorubrum halalkaliphilum]MXV64565.1 restriction endonuclease [Natronorubrum halalkaliphilum]
MAILDDLSGYEFEDLMEDVFRNLGYENVRQSRRTADEGRDILMEEVVDGRRRAIVVECKHTATVGRPDIRKLHSAVETFEYDGPVRGMVVTSGRVTDPAREYAQNLGSRRAGGIELLDGRALREIGEEVGADLYNGRIEILCEESLRPTHPTAGRDVPVFEAAREIANLEPATVPTPETTVELEPMVTVHAQTSATFETGVGVVHSLDETNDLVIRAGRETPRIATGDLKDLVANPSAPRIELKERDLEDTFDAVERTRFSRTETTYKQWAIDRLQQVHTTTVEYTGGNNVDYEKTCTPRVSDISIWTIDPVYVPHVSSTFSLGEYDYRYAYYAAGPSRSTTTNDLSRCVHCEGDGAGANETYTHCDNCGSINCGDHIETERLEGEPVCTVCAVTESFAFDTKYFYDEANLEAFREEYAAMPISEKARENVPLAVGAALCVVLVALLVVGSVVLV